MTKKIFSTTFKSPTQQVDVVFSFPKLIQKKNQGFMYIKSIKNCTIKLTIKISILKIIINIDLILFLNKTLPYVRFVCFCIYVTFLLHSEYDQNPLDYLVQQALMSLYSKISW